MNQLGTFVLTIESRSTITLNGMHFHFLPMHSSTSLQHSYGTQEGTIEHPNLQTTVKFYHFCSVLMLFWCVYKCSCMVCTCGGLPLSFSTLLFEISSLVNMAFAILTNLASHRNPEVCRCLSLFLQH